MPTRRVKDLLATTAAVSACAALMVPATAAAARGTTTTSNSGCTLPATTQVFSAFGDLGYYYLAPGGSFETLTWSKVGAPKLVVENESYQLAGSRHRYSVQLEDGESVTSPKFCISQDQPFLRFLARAYGFGPMDVRVDVYGSNGLVAETTTTTIGDDEHTEWAPTEPIMLNTSTMGVGQKAYATLTIASEGSWLVDDVFIDPYRR